MKIEPGKFCPLIKKDCIGIQCNWFIQLRGKHPQSGADVDEWGCAIAWMPILLIEGAKETRQGAAAIESFRNEMVRANAAIMNAGAAEGRQRLGWDSGTGRDNGTELP